VPAFCSVNGFTVLDGSIYLPRVGVWHADLSVDTFDTLTGPVTVQLPSQTLQGRATRSGSDAARRLRLRVVGGNAGLASVVTPKSYGSVPLRIPLTDALTAAGERLSPTADTSLLNTQLAAWSNMAAPANSVIASLLQAVPGNPAWRVLIDGTVWVGFETWPVVTLPDTVLISSDPENGRVTIASDAPAILPGVSFSYLVPGVGQVSKQVSYLQHLISSGMVRTVFFSE